MLTDIWVHCNNFNSESNKNDFNWIHVREVNVIFVK